MNRANPSTFTDRANPSVRSATVESLPVVAEQDRSLRAFSDRKINRARYPRDEWDRCWFVTFANDLQCAVPAAEGEIFNVCAARFAHT